MTKEERAEIIKEVCNQTNEYTCNMINNIPKDKDVERILNLVMIVLDQNKVIIKAQDEVKKALELKQNEDKRWTLKKIFRWAFSFTFIVLTIYNTLTISVWR
jgi:hypothetical protein